MKREEFLRELEYQLHRLPKAEREEAMAFYQDYLDDAGPEQEEAVLRSLGSPKEVAAQIIQDTAVKAVEAADASPQKTRGILSTVWVVILAIFASPIALPLAAAAVAVMVAFLAVILAVLASIFVLLVASGISGVLSVLYGIPVLFTAPASGMVVVGLGLAMVGVGLIVLLGLVECGGAALNGVIRLFSRMLRRHTSTKR